MVTVEYGWGNRLGNCMLMYVAALLFAKKHGFAFNSPHTLPCFPLSPESPTATTTGFNEKGYGLQTIILNNTRSCNKPFIPVHDLNFLELLNQNQVPDAEYHFQHYFQIKEFVLQYKNELRDLFIRDYTPRQPEQMFVVVRLGDVAKRRQRLPLLYYVEAIELLQSKGCKGGCIASDSMNHPDVLFLLEKYGLRPYNCNIPIETINFGKDFNNLVLSEGTYCWWIGLLSNATNIVCNDRRDKFTWHGDIFVYPDWIKLHHDNPGLPVDPV